MSRSVQAHAWLSFWNVTFFSNISKYFAIFLCHKDNKILGRGAKKQWNGSYRRLHFINYEMPILNISFLTHYSLFHILHSTSIYLVFDHFNLTYQSLPIKRYSIYISLSIIFSWVKKPCKRIFARHWFRTCFADFQQIKCITNSTLPYFCNLQIPPLFVLFSSNCLEDYGIS